MSETRRHDTSGAVPRNQAPGGRTNTIGMRNRELEVFLDTLDSCDMAAINTERTFRRWPFRRPSVRMHIVHADGSVSRIPVACRNLSCGGMSVLHNAFVYDGSECLAALQRVNGEFTAVRGTVLRCLHISGVIHELGVQFDTLIDPREYLHLDPLDAFFSLEKVDPKELWGRIVHIEASETDHKRVKRFLGRTNLSIRTAVDAAAGFAMAQDGCELILANLSLMGIGSKKLIEDLRKTGVGTPVIMIVPDLDDLSRDELLESGADAYLTQPLDGNSLIRSIAEFLFVKSAGEPIRSLLAEDDELQKLVPAFVRGLQRRASQLATSLDRDDAVTCRSICQRIEQEASELEFPEISDLADKAAEHIATTMTVIESAIYVRHLIAACRRVQVTAAL